jgi:HSP20 family protein
MTIQRGNPFLRDFVSLRDAVDRLFEESVVSPERLMNWRGSGVRPMPLEIYETPEELVVRALTPGVSPDQLEVNYQQGTLTLRARTETPSAHDDWTWHMREFGYGEMVRTISLPREIDADRAEASFEHGILTLHLPKAEEAKPRQIPISGQQVQIGSGSGNAS